MAGSEVDPTQLPEGFTLENDPTQLPPGFTLEAGSEGAPNFGSLPEYRSFTQEIPAAIERAPSHLPFADRATAGLGVLADKVGSYFGHPLGTGDYDTNLAKVRAYNEQQWKENPGVEAGAEGLSFVGPAAGIVGKVQKAAGGVGAVMRGMAGGGLWSGVQGASDIPDYPNMTPEDLKNVTVDTGLGAITGGAIPLFARGAGNLVRGVANILDRAATVPGVSRAAQNQFTKAIGGNAEPTIQRMQEIGPRAMPLDANEGLTNIASGVANSEDIPSRMALRDTLTARNEGGDAQLQAALDQNYGPNIDSDITLAVMKAQRKALGDGPFNAAKAAQGNNVSVDTSNIIKNLDQKIVDSKGNPQMQAVLEKTRNLLTDEARGPSGQVVGTVPVTDPVSLHNTKEYLGGAFKNGDQTLGIRPEEINQTNGSARKLYGEINEALRGTVPGYADANDKLSSIRRQEEQMRGNVLSGNYETAVSPDSHKLAFDVLSPVEQNTQALRTRDLIQRSMGVKGNDLLAVNNILQGPGGFNTGKLANTFGEIPTQNVVNTAAAEKAMRDKFSTITQNSETQNRAAVLQALKAGAPSQNPIFPYFGPGSSWKNLPSTGINAMISALRNPSSNAQYWSDLARGVSLQGQEGQNFVKAMADAYNARARNAALAEALNRGAQVTGGTAMDTYYRRRDRQ